MTDLAERVARAVGEHHDVVVAFSGGLDSTALLHAAIEALGAQRVVAIHIDHGLRRESADEAAHAESVARSLGVGAEAIAIRVGSGNTQARARSARYGALVRAAQRHGCSVILTAHHADDAVETALDRMARGAGLSGVTGLRQETTISGFPITRPFLDTPRADIEEWSRARELGWFEDPTNRTSDYTRTRLRHTVIPALTNERDAAPLRRSVELMRDDARIVEEAAQRLADAAKVPTPEWRKRRLRRDWLATAEPTLRLRAVATTARELGLELNSSHLEDLEAAFDNRESTAIDVAAGRIRLGDPYLRLARLPDDPEVTCPATIDLGDGGAGALPWFDHVILWGTDSDGEHLYLEPGATVTVDGPRPGARLAFEAGHKRVVELLRESGVPARERWRWPCLYVESTCVAVLGCRTTTEQLGDERVSWSLARRASGMGNAP